MKWQSLSIYVMRSVGRMGIVLICIATTIVYSINQPITFIKTNTASSKRTIIFDLGGVLFATSSIKSLWYLGPKTVIQYWYHTKKSLTGLKKVFYTTLNKISNSSGNCYGTKDYMGDDLPELMCRWLAGTQSASEIRKYIITHIKNHPEWFAHKTEQLLMLRMTSMIFTPTVFVNTITPLQEGIALARTYKKQGYRLVILSNWDPTSFKLLQKKYPSIFNLFDEIIVSGHLHMLKPHPSIFDHLISHYNPSMCVFIDDQDENINAAHNAGIHAIQCPHTKTSVFSNPTFSKVRHQLIQWKKQTSTSSKIETI